MADQTNKASNVTTIQEREAQLRGKPVRPRRSRHVAARCREEKERHPERYCSHKRCLWDLASGDCPKHGAAPSTIDLMERLQTSLAKSARAQTQVVAETLQPEGGLGPESASEHVRNALQILTKPDDEIDELDLAAVRERLRIAVEQLEHVEAF